MVKDRIKVAILRPGPQWTVKLIPNDLDAFQEIVGGPIELVSLTPRVNLYCHEEGKLLHLPPSASLVNEGQEVDVLCGPIFLVGPVDEEGYDTSITAEGFAEALNYLCPA